ncbi:hypothetical protein KIN20_020800 [Parelaphostrongylus tenuis]|uniref:Uncharacterized protein n=1 Tax=Parelaphostrongylus tenuis TaxID=148309 RepID=A0AAD5QTU8_PARTN|nr:hypothetical protein KIN20_020800 [Parelaphostrongylus tenuis]
MDKDTEDKEAYQLDIWEPSVLISSQMVYRLIMTERCSWVSDCEVQRGIQSTGMVTQAEEFDMSTQKA